MREPPQEELGVLQEEVKVAESDPIEPQPLDSTPTSSSEPEPESETPEEEETLPPELEQGFEDALFEDLRNTSKYLCQKRPPISATLMEPYEKEYLLRTIKELTAIMSNEWLLKGEASSTPLEVTHSSSVLRCHVRDQLVNALYNPTIGANIMSHSFAFTHLGNVPLSPTGRTL